MSRPSEKMRGGRKNTGRGSVSFPRGSTKKKTKARGSVPPRRAPSSGAQNPYSSVVNLTALPGNPSQSKRVQLVYTDNVQVSSTAGAAGAFVWSANGAYDPNITGTGHQPVLFDQMMDQFEHYCVLWASIKVDFLNVTGSGPFCVGLSVNAGPTPQTNYTRLMEGGLMKYLMLGSTSAGGNIQQLTLSTKIGKFLGVPNVLNDTDLRGFSAGNPVEQVYFHISVWDPTSLSVAVVNCCVNMKFDVVFVEPRNYPSSLVTVRFKYWQRVDLEKRAKLGLALPRIRCETAEEAHDADLRFLSPTDEKDY